VAHLSQSQIRAFQIADNRLTGNSSWNRAALAEELQILKTANVDFDLSSTGFEIEEINLMTLGLELASAIKPTKASEELTSAEREFAVSRSGSARASRTPPQTRGAVLLSLHAMFRGAGLSPLRARTSWRWSAHRDLDSGLGQTIRLLVPVSRCQTRAREAGRSPAKAQQCPWHHYA
jgi:hypothetical protein